MENNIMKRTSAVQSDRGCSSTLTGLDENLWGTLQHHIDLAENVYPKLPFEEFFQLRIVCKDWYVIACKRLGLKDPIRKPFFTLYTRSKDGQLDGILTYNALSQSWDWRPDRTHVYDYQFVASKGVVYFGSAFHWQSKAFQHLDLAPIPTPNIFERMILGMIVSEEQGPFSSFRVVRGSENFDTQVYESEVRQWQTKPCRVPKPEGGVPLLVSNVCADCNGRVYIPALFSREIFVYDFEKARMNWSLQVWELVDEALHKWKVYDCMPIGLCSWLRSTEGFLNTFHTKAGDTTIEASFCGDFILVYSWDFVNGSTGRFCLFNMATKNWQKLNIAARIVAIR